MTHDQGPTDHERAARPGVADTPDDRTRLYVTEECPMSHNRGTLPCLDRTPFLVHGLTFYQPEATLTALGEKTLDTRRWGTDYRGWVAIHAAPAPVTPVEWLARAATVHYAEALARHHLLQVPFGQIIAFARLARTEEIRSAGHATFVLAQRFMYGDSTDRERHFGDYAVGRRIWFWDKIVPLEEPIPHPGGRGLWHWTPPQEARDAIATAFRPEDLLTPLDIPLPTHSHLTELHQP